MSEGEPMTREERLAAKLRENLRRRKAQARALGDAAETDQHANAPESGESLPKPGPSR